MTALSYTEPVSKLLSLEPLRHFGSGWLDYSTLGISAADAPELLRMSLDQELYAASSDSQLIWGPVHAWRALGQFRATEVTNPLLGLLDEHEEDDWVCEELPHVFAMFGAVVLPELSTFVGDPERNLWARIAAAEAMKEIAQSEPDRRDEVVATLSRQLSKWYRNDETLNALLIGSLIDLRATEATAIIEEAFMGERVDLIVNGDWEDVQIELGLRSERETPRPRLHSPRFVLPLSEPATLGGHRPGKQRSTVQKAKRKAERKARKRNRRR